MYHPASKFFIPGYLIVICSIAACNKNIEQEVLSDQNKWILDSMKVYYYWNGHIHADPENISDPEVFFKSLLHRQDKFSFIQNPYQTPSEYSSFVWYGFEYDILVNRNQPGQYIGVVTLVVPGSPSESAGLRRGHFFNSVNNILLNSNSLERVIHILKSGEKIEIGLASNENAQYVTDKTIDIYAAGFHEPVVYVSKVFEHRSRKAGYLFYNYFNGRGDEQLLNTLLSFKEQNIDELILDLRYNPGGDVSSAAKLAAVLCNAGADDTFVIYQANRNGGERISSFNKTIQENNYPPLVYTDIIRNRISLKRIIVLTTAATASAAELLINALKPYMQVTVIGTTTLGKDMASFAINDQRVPRQTELVLHPLVFKLYNADGKGGYNEGIIPDHIINELHYLPLKALGDAEDPLIAKALELTGINFLKTDNPLRSGSNLNPLFDNITIAEKSGLFMKMRRTGIPVLTKHRLENN